MRTHPRTFALLVALLLAAPLGGGTAAGEETGAPDGPILHVLGGRVRPLKPDGSAWDGDHRRIPPLVVNAVASAAGFPPLAALSLVPYRNRPDPYVVVLSGESEIARGATQQGTFLPVWALEVGLEREALPATLRLAVRDEDLRSDDAVGHVVLDVAALAARPGFHRVEGTAGLSDLDLVWRDGTAAGGAARRLVLTRVAVTARDHRPARGDWDAGGVPLRDRLPARLPLPETLEGLEARHPDLEIRARWLGGEEKRSPPGKDALEHVWEAPGLATAGRAGTGDGLVVFVVDLDALVADPVGVVYVPFERFLEAEGSLSVVVEPDEANGLSRVELSFAFEEEGSSSGERLSAPEAGSG